MGVPKPQEIKGLLRAKGFLVYRTGSDDVQLAERVRDNLIMEANVSVVVNEPLRVRLTTRAQRNDFVWSQESTAAMLARARKTAEAAIQLGYSEVATIVTPQLDPMDASNILDVWYQVVFEKALQSLDELPEALSFAIGLEKVASR